jgi:uncharacterized protein (TIGR03437 family)
MKVSIESASGVVSTFPVADYAPGIFPGSAQDSNFAPITTANPATRGRTIILYGTGFGPVNHPPASGDPAPDSSSNTMSTPVVTIGGIPGSVQFSGLAPGYAGLYQLNVTIPTDAQPGMQPVAITVNGVAANPVLLPIQ